MTPTGVTTPPASPSAPATAATATPADQPVADDKSKKVFDFKDGNSYSFALGMGYGQRDLGNGGMDHGGIYFRMAPGINLQLSERFRLKPRLFFEHQDLSKSLGEGIESSATVDTFGLEAIGSVDLVPRWLSFGAGIGIGAAMYGSPATSDGLAGGTEFNKNAQKYPIDSTAFRLQPTAYFGTLNDGLLLAFSYVHDSGINPTLPSVDGNTSPMGLNASGYTIGLMVDPVAISGLFGKKKTVVATAAPASGSVPAAGPQGAATPAAAAAPAQAPQLTGLSLFEQREKEAGRAADRAKSYAETAKQNNKNLKGEKDAAKSEALAKEAQAAYYQSVDQEKRVKKSLEELKPELEKLSAQDKKTAFALWKSMEKSAGDIHAAVQTAWIQASEAVARYNRDKASDEKISFPEAKAQPEPAPRPAARAGGGKKGDKKAQEAPKGDAPKPEAPKGDAPKPEAPKSDKPKAPQAGDEDMFNPDKL